MPLHDILPPIEISDHDFLYIVGVVFGVIVLVVYFYRVGKRKILSSFQILELCDFKDAKKTAFQFSYYGKKVFKNEGTKAKFLELEERLKGYKYAKETTPLPQPLEDEIKELLKEVKENDV